ncbi:MAG: response regulator transcription factor [Cytophagaceae bacterium]|nr:response regulator transcription factor [Cytophagaceae bacterium]MDW8456674.1 response regulator transcription factor [Cytophagaceae bacterium]
MYNVVIIEDNQEIRENFVELINMSNQYKVTGSYCNCQDALVNLKNDLPHIILMDIGLPGMSGIEGITEIKKNYPQVFILVITVFENSKVVFDSLCAGASGYIVKSTDMQKLLSALNEIINGGAPMSTQIAKMVVESFQKNLHSPLSKRETEILSLLASGYSYNGISDKLYISKETVKFHLKNIYLKLQVKTRYEAIEKAINNKFI